MRLYQLKQTGGNTLPLADLQSQVFAFDDVSGTWATFGKYVGSAPLPDVGTFALGAAAGVTMTNDAGKLYGTGMLDDDVLIITGHGVTSIATRIH